LARRREERERKKAEEEEERKRREEQEEAAKQKAEEETKKKADEKKPAHDWPLPVRQHLNSPHLSLYISLSYSTENLHLFLLMLKQRGRTSFR